MNILFVYKSLIIPTRGGTERATYAVANALQKIGHSIYFLTTCAEPDDAQLIQNENYLLIDKSLNVETKKRIIIDLCYRRDIDIIINEGGDFEDFSIFSKDILSGIKIITCLHFDVNGYIKDKPKGMSIYPVKKFLLKTLFFLGINPYPIKHYLDYRKKYQKMLKVSDAVVVVTPVIAEQLRKLTRIHPEKIHAILNPLPFDNLKPKYNINTKENMILYVGRFAKEKNVDVILKAWAQIAPSHPEWKLELAGTGYLHNEIKEFAKRQNIPRVHFHGHVHDIVPLYERAEYLILASSHESFSYVVLESMAHGCHPIVFDYPSAKIIIPTERLGTRIKNHSTKNLANTMSEAILTKRSNKHHLEEVKNHLSRFSMDKLVKEWQDLLEHVTKHKSDA